MSDHTEINETHDRGLRSWIWSANHPNSEFPIQNLPFGIFRRRESNELWRGGVAIGDQIVDLTAALALGLIDEPAQAAARACSGPVLNPFLELGPRHWGALRGALSRLLREGAPAQAASSLLVPQSEADMTIPVAIGDYTDFFASIHHARRTSRILRGDADVRPSYRYLPIGYHGRASSIVVSATPIPRPSGIRQPAGAAIPVLEASQCLDYELEVAAFIGVGNALGQPVRIEDAESHLFGLCLLNDWSARDLQAFEAVPLGPFLGKSFATTISPWIVTMAALAPFRPALEDRGLGDPQPLPHLADRRVRQSGGIDLQLEAHLQTMKMRKLNLPPYRLTRTSFRHLYWSFGQMLTHHASNGCNLRVGDLLGSGTISGPQPEAAGCLLEITEAGRNPIELPSSELRAYLEDGDDILISGRCERMGFRMIGFGVCRGRIVPGGGPAVVPDRQS